jgi:hypothetical protein
MGDALDASEQAMYNFDTLSMHTQFMQMIEDNQGATGDVPVVIPAGIPVFGFIFSKQTLLYLSRPSTSINGKVCAGVHSAIFAIPSLNASSLEENRRSVQPGH